MTFCTAINCIDGRVQIPVIQFLQKRFGVEYVDGITEPGPVRIFAMASDLMVLNSIFMRINISVQHHNSAGIAICAHSDCAGNPVEDETQQHQIRRAVIFLKESYPDTDVIGLWVDQNRTVSEIV